ncbi:MAG: helix-turn-helix transcriptional regulator [Clostridia bacterium]|nr:helix-turn-helix transcriptional regulator [Clostridia bacterium]
MKILYKQRDNFSTGLFSFGIENCYLKELSLGRDAKNILHRPHHHTGYELHLIINGCQEYETQDGILHLESGDFLLISPRILHKTALAGENTSKYSITFSFEGKTERSCLQGKVPPRIWDNIRLITAEEARGLKNSQLIIENCLSETIITFLRMAGLREEQRIAPKKDKGIIALAQQYIADNIEQAPGVGEVARYCHISSKQLTRLFSGELLVTPGEYINKARCARIEELLSDRSFTLKEICEKMNFSSEYYFNTFFKKYAGMPPGAYRKMFGK